MRRLALGLLLLATVSFLIPFWRDAATCRYPDFIEDLAWVGGAFVLTLFALVVWVVAATSPGGKPAHRVARWAVPGYGLLLMAISALVGFGILWGAGCF